MWKAAEFGELVGISPSTLRRWESEGKLIPERMLGNQRIYTEAHLSAARSLKTGKSATCVVVYCRVSSNGQKDDLVSQVKAMEQFQNQLYLVMQKSLSKFSNVRHQARTQTK